MKSLKLTKTSGRLAIDFKKEMYIRVFKEIVYKFNNKQSLDGEILFDISEIKNIIGSKERKALSEFMNNFHELDMRKECFTVLGEEWEIRGGMFSSKVTFKDKEPMTVGFMINGYWKDYFYSKMDLELWYKHKGDKKKLEKLVKEEKAHKKILDVMTDCINYEVKGKYNQRLLTLLNSSKANRKNGTLILKWDDFKKILDIPFSYKPADIDKRVLNKAKIELLKANIQIISIEKIKKGRSIDRIVIKFNILKDEAEEIKKKAIEPQEAPKKELSELDREKGKLIARLSAKGKFGLIETVIKVTSLEELETLREELGY